MSAFKNWHEEKQSAYLYELIARRERDPVRKNLFLELKDTAEKQAQIWKRKIKKKNRDEAELIFKPTFRARLVGVLVNLFGIEQIRFILSAMKVRGMSIYS